MISLRLLIFNSIHHIQGLKHSPVVPSPVTSTFGILDFHKDMNDVDYIFKYLILKFHKILLFYLLELYPHLGFVHLDWHPDIKDRVNYF